MDQPASGMSRSSLGHRVEEAIQRRKQELEMYESRLKEWGRREEVANAKQAELAQREKMIKARESDLASRDSGPG